MKRYYKFALLLAIPLALYFYTAERNSWRPRILEIPPYTHTYGLQFSPDGHYLFIRGLTPKDVNELVIFDWVSRRVVKTIEWANLFAVTNDYCLIEDPRLMGDLDVYALRDGRCLAKFFEAAQHEVYGALPDGRLLMSEKGEYQDWARSKHLLAWDFVKDAVAFKSNAPKPKAFQKNTLTPVTLLPPLFLPPPFTWNTPALKEDFSTRGREINYLADGQSLLLDDYVHIRTSAVTDAATLQVWGIPQKKILWRLKTTPPIIRSIVSTPDGLMAWRTGMGYSQRGYEEQVEIWNYKTGKRQSAIPLPFSSSGAHCIALSPDGTLLAAGLDDQPQVLLWDTKTGKLIRTITDSDTQDLIFSPDSRTLICARYDGIVKLWRVK